MPAEITRTIVVSKSRFGGTTACADAERGAREWVAPTRPVRAAVLDTRARTLVVPAPTGADR